MVIQHYQMKKKAILSSLIFYTLKFTFWKCIGRLSYLIFINLSFSGCVRRLIFNILVILLYSVKSRFS